MIHIMLDAYRTTQTKLDDMMFLYEVINKITYQLQVKPIMPPMLIPYYYGTSPEDNGISAFVFLLGGHFTIHTFSYRECYFIDLLYDGNFDCDNFIALVKQDLPCNDFRIKVLDRESKFENNIDSQKSSKEDFGPHLFARVETQKNISMDSLFDLFETLPYDVNMTPIMRPYLLKSSKNNPKYLSGIILVAQSHIAMHYNIETKALFIDMFSCTFTDFKPFKNSLEKYFETDIHFELISRGSKHEFARTDTESRRIIYNSWQMNSDQ